MKNINIFALKMANAMFAETLDNFQYLKRIIHESQICAYNSLSKNIASREITWSSLLESKVIQWTLHKPLIWHLNCIY
jgi:hypothetical protein